MHAPSPSQGAGFFRVQATESPRTEQDIRRWRRFQDVLRSYDADGVDLTAAYHEALSRPGRWVFTAPPVYTWQLIRALLGLSWISCESPVAIRCNQDGSVDIAYDAFKVVPRAQALPSRSELIRGAWSVQWVDRA